MSNEQRSRSAATSSPVGLSNLTDSVSSSSLAFKNDQSTWSKSKKKRMRLKRKKEEANRQKDIFSMEKNEIPIGGKPTGNSNGSGKNADKDKDITKRKNNKRKLNLANSSNDGESNQANNASSEGKKAKSGEVGVQGDPVTDAAITSSTNKNIRDKKKHKSVSDQSKHRAISQSTSTVTSNSRTDKTKNKNKMRKNNTDDDASKVQNKSTENDQPKQQTTTSITHAKLKVTPPKMMSTLQKSFLERLTSSRFRELNEELYTHSSHHSFKHFTENPDLFEQYHIGFRKQVKEWPVNPVDVIYKKILNGWKKQQSEIDENAKRVGKAEIKSRIKLVIADFGCGDAKLAERLLSVQVPIGSDRGGSVEPPSKKRKKAGQTTSSWCPFEVHSFDLVSGGNKLVTPSDMCNVPLPNESVDVGVYSLALMGTNVADFVREGWRVLKFGGCLRVAEVRSRFETTANEDEEGREGGGKRGKLNNGKKLKRNTSAQFGKEQCNNGMVSTQPVMLIDEFLSLMQRCGFECTNFDRNNKMFLFMDFIKVDGSKGLSENEEFSAKPCIYKRR
ncbi:hypothetical protein ACHAXS_013789 [Conticribra weissflogii]